MMAGATGRAHDASLSDLLRAARARQRLTQRELATLLGVAIATVGRWERDETLPQSHLLPALAELLGEDVSDLRHLCRARPEQRPDNVVAMPLSISADGEVGPSPDRGGRFLDAVITGIESEKATDPTWSQNVANVARILGYDWYIAGATRDPDEILRLSESPDYPGIHVLGPIDEYLTVRAQQTRALNIAYALTERVRAGGHIGIVGGGIGGMTVALGCLRLGARVTVFERERDLLHRMADASHRFIHPRILEWPTHKSSESDAGLPVLDWQAADGATLTKHWRAEVEVNHRHFGDRFVTRCRVTNLTVTPSATGVEITFNAPQDADLRVDVDACVICVGYGADQPIGAAKHITDGYWEPDTLHRPKDERTKILVSGTGDGGLADLFRATLHDFSLSAMLEETVEANLSTAEIKRIVEVEEAMRRGDEQTMTDFYHGLHVPAIVSKLKQQLRSDCTITLNGNSASMFSARACCANRVILSQLRFVPGGPQYLRGTVGEQIVLDDQIIVTIGGREIPFDKVVLRHGPNAGLGREFPDLALQISANVNSFRRALLGGDPLRTPHWPDDHFSASDGLASLADQIAKERTTVTGGRGHRLDDAAEPPRLVANG